MSDELVTGTPAGSDTPAPPAAAPQAAPADIATAPPQAVPLAPASGAPAIEPSWLKQRLDETRHSTERRLNAEFQRRETEYQQRLTQNEARIRALVGVDSPPDPQITQVRDQFGRLYPCLSKI